jgi:hypothetical protein
MSRVKGGKLTVTYDSTKRQPLDSRMLVTKREDLINPTIWITNGTDTNAMFNGMIVAVNNDNEYNGVYYLEDRLLVTQENFTAYKEALAAGEDIEPFFSMWEKLIELDDIDDIEDKVKEIEKHLQTVDYVEEEDLQAYYTKEEVEDVIEATVASSIPEADEDDITQLFG